MPETVTITLTQEEARGVRDALATSERLFKANANTARTKKFCGITRAGWQRLADRDRNVIAKIERAS